MNENSNIPRKRVGYARKSARKILENYFVSFPPRAFPVQIESVAKSLGFEIYMLDSLEQGHRAMKLEIPDEKRRLIGIGSTYHPNNRRFSIAHEIGHHVMGHPPETDCTEEEIKLYNSEADEFAAEILIPLDELKRQLKNVKDVKAIALYFKVSEQALWIKLSSNNLLSSPHL